MFDGFEQRELTLQDTTRTVWCGGEGPPIVVMHEVPGLHPGVVEFARRVVGEGFSIYMPSLFGSPGKAVSAGYSLRTIARACVSREFATWASGRNSAMTDWLRALARLAHEETGHKVGAVGMCLTGGFALAMMVEDCLEAPVLSQPSLPFPTTAKARRDLGIDAATLASVKRRADDGVCVLGLRFTGDRMVPRQRFEALRAAFGENFIAVEIDSSPGNDAGIGRFAHSVLTHDFVDEPGHPTLEALETVIAFFHDALTKE